jgi:hypothetical protein
MGTRDSVAAAKRKISGGASGATNTSSTPINEIREWPDQSLIHSSMRAFRQSSGPFHKRLRTTLNPQLHSDDGKMARHSKQNSELICH